jgi:uncharacterized protein (TIGR00290 family)
MSQKPVLLAWSGGKDSALALARLRERDDLRVVGLVTTVTAGYDRISIHGVRRTLLHQQAAATGLPLHEVTLQPKCSNADYDLALERTLTTIREATPALDRIAYGDIFLEDVRRYREERLGPLGWSLEFPLWGSSTTALARSVIECGFEARLVCVDTECMPSSFAGRAYDEALLSELPADVDPCGERGEFHTFVHAGPVFSTPIPHAVGDVIVREERWAYCDLE